MEYVNVLVDDLFGICVAHFDDVVDFFINLVCDENEPVLRLSSTFTIW